MFFLSKLLSIINNRNKKPEYKPGNKTPFTKDIEANLKAINSILADCDDVIYREFYPKSKKGEKLYLIYADEITDKSLLDEFVLQPLIQNTGAFKTDDIFINNLRKNISNSLPVSQLKEYSYIEDAVVGIISGYAVLVIEGNEKAIGIEAIFVPTRNISEPTTDPSVRGPKESFNELIRTNISLVRHRIKDPRLKLKYRRIGSRSKTMIAILFFEDIVDRRILDQVNIKLDKLNIEFLLSSGQLAELIEDRKYSLFPQIQFTERPDTVCGSIVEGRVVLLVDGSANALILPVTLMALLLVAEDYHIRPSIAGFTRIIRMSALLVSILLPSLYIAITSYNPELIPLPLALFIASTREGVPFTAFVEAFSMEITFELLREASVRLPRAIGSTIGIVGGLVIGQAAVAAGLVGPVMVVVVALTAIASFAIPNYEIAAAFRIIRFLLMVLSSIYGLYGVVLGFILVMIHLVNIKSFGVPYMAPLAPFIYKDLKDTLIRISWQDLEGKKPKHINPQEQQIQEGGNNHGNKG